MLLPFVANAAEAAALLERMDGLLLSGGGDVDPRHFGEDPHPRLGTIEPERDTSEMLLARAALDRQLPVLAICRGEQVLAVSVGGTLWQDISSQVPQAIKHAQQAPRWYPTHAVQVAPGSRLAGILGAGAVRVNSYHHQAVKALPPGWQVTATAPDGLIEAFEAEQGFALAVQWHPENFAPQGGEFDALFRAHVEAAAAYRGNRSGPA